MNVTDVVEARTLRELNRCLASAIGMSMMMVDGDGGLVALHGVPRQPQAGMALCPDCDSPELDQRCDFAGVHRTSEAGWMDEIGRFQPQGIAVPVEAGDQRIATWYVGDALSSGDSGCGGVEHFMGMERIPGAAHTQFCEVPTAAAVQVCNSAVALVSKIADIISNAASANRRAADEVERYLQLALDNAVQRNQLQRITDAAPVGLIEVSREGDICWTNEQAELLLGMTEPTSVSGTDGQVCTVASIDDAEPAISYARIARRLVRGETVRGIRCVLCRRDGEPFTVRVDAVADVSEHHRLERVILALLPEEGSERRDDSRPSWSEVRALLNVANTRSVTSRADIARGLQHNVIDLLQYAWVEFDGLRHDLAKEKQPALSGRMDTVAFQLQEAIANTAALASASWPNLWDHYGVASAIECRLGDLESRFGIRWSFKDRSHGLYSLDADRCALLYRVAEELLSDTSVHARRADVVLDANQHYWLLVVSVEGDGLEPDESQGSVVPRIRAELRQANGTVETVARDGGRIVRYVILPTSG